MNKCPVCGKGIYGEGEFCVKCERDRQKMQPKSVWAASKCCVMDCIDPGFQPLKGKIYCYRHYLNAWADDYVPQATQDQISKFLIKMSRKSIYWEKATEGQKQAALEYYEKIKTLEVL